MKVGRRIRESEDAGFREKCWTGRKAPGSKENVGLERKGNGVMSLETEGRRQNRLRALDGVGTYQRCRDGLKAPERREGARMVSRAVNIVAANPDLQRFLPLCCKTNFLRAYHDLSPPLIIIKYSLLCIS